MYGTCPILFSHGTSQYIHGTFHEGTGLVQAAICCIGKQVNGRLFVSNHLVSKCCACLPEFIIAGIVLAHGKWRWKSLLYHQRAGHCNLGPTSAGPQGCCSKTNSDKSHPYSRSKKVLVTCCWSCRLQVANLWLHKASERGSPYRSQLSMILSMVPPLDIYQSTRAASTSAARTWMVCLQPESLCWECSEGRHQLLSAGPGCI